jgi:pyridoxine 4-dehydrogenase
MIPAASMRPSESVLENLDSLQLDQVPVVNLRRHPEAGVPFDEQVAAMVAMRGAGQIGGGIEQCNARGVSSCEFLTEVACVQNGYNLADRFDKALFDACAADGVPYVPFFPLGSAFSPENSVLTDPAVISSATRLGVTAPQIALAWLLLRSPNVLLIPGTSTLVHLRQNGRCRGGPRRPGTRRHRMFATHSARRCATTPILGSSTAS